HLPLLTLAVLAALPALAYAWDMARFNRMSLTTGDITNNVDHYSAQAALALVLVALPAVAAWRRPPTRRLLGTSTVLMGAYLGLVSYAWPGVDAGFGAPWSIAAMVWAAAVLVAAWWRRPSPSKGA